MRRFLLRVSLYFLVPVVILSGLYFITDPYKTLKPFSLDYFDSTNRDYLSTELYLMNSSQYDYDSFVFGSSRGCGLNTYHWKKYLGESARPFLFQAWNETLTGIEQKVTFLDEKGDKIRNALILIDIPGTFSNIQLHTEALSLKDPVTSGQPAWEHQLILLYDFIQKPSQWIKACVDLFSARRPTVDFDSVTNDWDISNLYFDFDNPPAKDSLKNYSSKKLKEFMKDYSTLTVSDLRTSDKLITEKQAQQLTHIKNVFKKHNTNFRIIITPGYCYSFPSISPDDLDVLNDIFGKNTVYDYSGYNALTSDYNNFSDPNHFGRYAGWVIMENIYNGREL